VTAVRGSACVVVLALCFGAAAEPPVDGLALARALAATSRAAVERAVASIEHAPASTPHLEQALREAGRACEDVLADPSRALALYDRILAEFPDGAAASIVRPRARVLRDRIGTAAQYATEASELAALAASDLPDDEVTRRADALAARTWPGAPDAALFVATRLERSGRFAEAQRRYAAVEDRWPGTPQAIAARRGGLEVAIVVHDWGRAAALARGLPVATSADRALHSAVLERIERGRGFDAWYRVSWVLMIGAAVGLLGSLFEASMRGGWQRLSLAPPIETYFLLPIGAVLVGVALTTHAKIAPAVATLTIGGIVLAWISGITLDRLRRDRRAIGVRVAVHVVLCAVVVAALGYIALRRGDLLEMLIETVQFGPE
jgi:tetratricopeptide (TPR) repeat protein